MKKLITLFGIILMSVTLTSCSSAKGDNQSADNDFVVAIGKGLEERNNTVNSASLRGLSETENNEILSEAIKDEMNNLKDFQNKEFQNPELKKLYDDYIKQLEIQDQYVVYFNDFENFEKQKIFEGAYNERSKLINTLIDKYGLKINSELAKEFKNNSKKVESNEALENSLIESLKKANFKKEETYYVRGNVRNDTGEKLTNKIIHAKFINDENVTVDNCQYYIDGNWEKDEVRTVEFILSSEKSFSKMEFNMEEL
ncbi:MAG: hypothetical protein RR561_05225 [Peptostreptococcus sp.]|uniref:hypothetical protein n=1 Tax=Peptostreptococcus sp. TaxID=1262 RepID=UPI002FCA12E8